MKYSRAFSFIELSIFITILAIIFTTTLVINDRVKDVQRAKDTEQKINIIRNAVADYYYANGRLPCPADPQLDVHDATFGNEIYSSGCAATNNVKNTNEIYYGTVPNNSLKLPIDNAFDGWGRKLSYVIDNSVAESGSISTPSNNPEGKLELWYDASDFSSITLDANKRDIIQINDKSGKLHHATPTNASYKPSYEYNKNVKSMPGINFDGGGDMISLDSIAASLDDIPYTIIMAISGNVGYGVNSFPTLFAVTKATENYSTDEVFLTTDSAVYWRDNPNASIAIVPANKINKQGVTVFTVKRSENDITARVNTTAETTKTRGYDATTTAAKFTFGGRWYGASSGNYIAITLHEFMLFLGNNGTPDTDPLTDAQIQKYENYLIKKWGGTSSNGSNLVDKLKVQIKSGSGTVEDRAAFAIISHGKNGLGAFNANGVELAASTDSDEQGNSYNSFAAQPLTLTTDYKDGKQGGAWTETFDDIVRYTNFLDLNALVGKDE